MNGKILRISANDLYGNVDEREVAVFAAFTHKKYMNKYVIFTFKDEYQKNKLYYGSVHLKENSIVTFSITDDNKKHVDKFIESYLNNQVDPKEYEIIDISKIDKVELVSYSEMDFDKLVELDNLSIPKPKVLTEETTKKKPAILYILLVIMLILLAGVIFLYLNPHFFDTKVKTMTCTLDEYNKKIKMPYTITKTIRFDKENKLKDIAVVEIYSFTDEEEYYDFKDNERQNEYFDITGAYKYDDDNLELRIIYDEETIISEYEEMKGYLKKEKYICTEESHYE